MNEMIIKQLEKREEAIWLNPKLRHMEPFEKIDNYGFIYIKGAQNRFMRYLPYMASVFPETAEKKGVIESPLLEIPQMKEWLNSRGAGIEGAVYLKDDAHLPIAGSVKARGGIHEVMRIAESVAMQKGFRPADDHMLFTTPEYRELFAEYTIQVGSTGNLGISIGRTAARMGFQVIVHMSSDAKQWKKDLLRKEGAVVREYDSDYSTAVAKGREEAAKDPKSYFVDDENSKDLFFGYATAALRLKVQLRKAAIPVDEQHPLFVYIPCGVGGAPAGITYGLKQEFGDNVHCFFAEPVEAPCFTLGLASGRKQEICVQDIGLSGKTAADGLAVGRPSGFASDMTETLVSGCFTCRDERLSEYQKQLEELEKVHLELSACAGFAGLEQMQKQENAFASYLKEHEIEDYMDWATHIVWGTGGGLEPQ